MRRAEDWSREALQIGIDRGIMSNLGSEQCVVACYVELLTKSIEKLAIRVTGGFSAVLSVIRQHWFLSASSNIQHITTTNVFLPTARPSPDITYDCFAGTISQAVAVDPARPWLQGVREPQLRRNSRVFQLETRPLKLHRAQLRRKACKKRRLGLTTMPCPGSLRTN